MGRSICMESPPLCTPTRVFLRACAINNREWACGSNPAWVCPYDRRQMLENQRITTFTLCKSETRLACAHVRVGGCASESVGVCATPPSTPIFIENCHSHTDSLPRPPVVPKCVRSRLLCAHNVCVVVPECQRVALCAPIRVHALVVCAHDCVPECPLAHVLAHNAPRYTPAHPHTHECVPMYAPKCGVAYCVRGRT